MALFETIFAPYHAFGSRTLRLQTPFLQGTDVAILQGVFDLLLEVMNPPQGPIGPPVPITGVYDQATAQMVRNIESYFGLAVDGVAGEDVYFVYGQGVGSHVTYGGPVYGSRTLSQGVSGGDVTVLQNRLNTFRYSSILGGPANGTFGAKTAAAVTAFQQDAILNGDTDMPTDGSVDGSTFDALWIYTFAGGRGLFQGRNGLDVTFVQTILKSLGFYTGALDGFYGSKTETAVADFQDAEHISSDGVVGPATFFHIGLHNQQSAPRPFPNIPF